ncbi:MAG: 3-hydroxyacyl-ACP dehydratase [Bacteroidetes bacterium]|nr:3-hydroxyacyl-ACP dehydratase [Bacteroidota bacterium]
MEDTDQETVQASIRFDANHRIFQGHFPGFPVVPGVCMIQIIKEIIALRYRISLFLTTGDNIKFLRFIDPRQSPDVRVKIRVNELDGIRLKADALIYDEESNFLKFKGVFLKEA